MSDYDRRRSEIVEKLPPPSAAPWNSGYRRPVVVWLAYRVIAARAAKQIEMKIALLKMERRYLSSVEAWLAVVATILGAADSFLDRICVRMIRKGHEAKAVSFRTKVGKFVLLLFKSRALLYERRAILFERRALVLQRRSGLEEAVLRSLQRKHLVQQITKQLVDRRSIDFSVGVTLLNQFLSAPDGLGDCIHGPGGACDGFHQFREVHHSLPCCHRFGECLSRSGQPRPSPRAIGIDGGGDQT